MLTLIKILVATKKILTADNAQHLIMSTMKLVRDTIRKLKEVKK
jgi:hypothetical protein